MTAPAENLAPTWTPPGPGSWVCDRSHIRPGPTPVYTRIVGEHTEPVYRDVMERFGGAIASLDMQVVHGHLYRRLVPLVGARFDRGTLPPKPVLWLVSRLHPEFRRREKTAAIVLADQTFLAEIETWRSTERHEWIEGNRQLQAVDVGALDDRALADHLGALDERLVEGWRRHHELHANDLGPIGDLLAHCTRWGIEPAEVMELLRGSSPATTEARAHGIAIAEALRSTGTDPITVDSIEAIRAVPAAADALDTYLDDFGWRLVSNYDIEGLTLHELPDAVIGLVRAGARADATEAEPSALDDDREGELRRRAADGDLFDELLAAARDAYGVRDDNGPLTWAWPAGLTRRAYLEAGRRLAGRQRIGDEADVFELDIDELRAVLVDAGGPSQQELDDRARHRAHLRTLTAPDVLGPPPPEPDLSALPPNIARMMGIIVAATTLLDPEPLDSPGSNAEPGSTGVTTLTGTGIGRRSLRARAQVVDDPVRAVAELEPGDVLVAAWTAPSFNAVLSIAGGVVVQEGGVLCHAAVMARELDIPAVVGCAGAMDAITSGDEVEIDPAAGTVTVVGSSPG